MSKMSREKVMQDIDQSTQVFLNELGIMPRYYAVPFGQMTGNLLVI